MSPERHFDVEEVAAIFERAAADVQSIPRQSGGLTLEELQEIGKESGISADAIARAAAAVGSSAPTSLRPPTTLGVRVGVARQVDFERTITGEEWDQIVADLQSTFHAAGKIVQIGSVRQWRDDQVTVQIEPGETGDRLRFDGVTDGARGGLAGGLILVIMGLFFTLLVAAKAGDADVAKLLFTSMFSVVGLGSMIFSAYRARQWSSGLDAEVEAIATRAIERSRPKSPQQEDDSVKSGRIDPGLLREIKDEGRTGTSRRTRS